ncbi:MAG TPA: IS4 family transposase [Deltaproteobacteria bacterium]|nr:IS4 family transposase [Deltaproteobacteria bacterium]
MVRCSSLFSQVLSLVDRMTFHKLVLDHDAERHAKGYSSWAHFVAMLFCQLAQAKSIREICGGLACCVGKIRHLGLYDFPRKSTLAYANAHRPWEMYRDLFYHLLDRYRGSMTGKKRKFRFRNKLLTLDSTTISLCLSMFPWAQFRRTKGAVKLHLLLDHDGYLPTYAYISNGKRHDVTVARRVPLTKGSIVTMDKGYNDYSLFSSWTDAGIYFVTRMKDNAVYEVMREREVPVYGNLIADQHIAFAGLGAWQKCPHILRRVVVWDEAHNEEIVLLTNHFSLAASTISAIYKDRWEIEIFFKTLKQNLKVKTFVGTSENALYIQIWTALIAMLVIKYLHHLSTFSWSLSNLVSLLRWNLFTYRDLLQWLDDPYETPPAEPVLVQDSLPLPGLGQQVCNIGSRTTRS